MSEKLSFELGRPSEVIADEINVIKEQTRKMIIHASSEIGRRLIEAKEQVRPGEWMEWLKTNVDYSQSTANNFMKIHREFDLNSQAFANLTYTKAVALFGIDQDERAAFAEEVGADEISVRDLEKLVKEKQQLEAEKRAIEEQLAAEKRASDESLEQMQMQLTSLEEQLTQNAQEQENNKRMEQELAVAESTIQQLQNDLKAKPIEASAVVEVVPDEIQKELDELRAAQSEKSIDPAKIKFQVQFDGLIKSFSSSLEALSQIANEDDKKTYKAAMHKLMDKMRGTLEGI